MAEAVRPGTSRRRTTEGSRDSRMEASAMARVTAPTGMLMKNIQPQCRCFAGSWGSPRWSRCCRGRHERGESDRHQCPPASGHEPSPPGWSAASVRQRCCTSFLYVALVQCSYTSYMYEDRLPCTAYSCQVMASTQARDAAERARLSKAAVVEQALALGDAEGLEALTYRRLAQQLGVTPMALYWHFRNKEEMLGGLAERIWSEIDTDI